MATWRLRVDLHTHTSYSDGLDSPTQLVAKAAQQGLHSIAITDHDILAALPEAQQAGLDCGVEVLVGVELTVQYQQYDDIHLLGYFFDPTHAALQAQLALAQQHRVQRGVADAGAHQRAPGARREGPSGQGARAAECPRRPDSSAPGPRSHCPRLRQ